MKFMTPILALCLFATHAVAQSQSDVTDALTHRILPGWTQDDGTRIAAIELDLAKGWKTYWRSPGDAGIPPGFDWRKARNMHSIRVQWPTPVVFWEAGIRSVGYKSRVVIPMVITPKQDGQDIRVRGQMTLGLCADICVPVQIQLDETLPAKPAQRRNSAIVAALAALPYSRTEAGVTSVTCKLKPADNGAMSISARITMPSAGRNEETIIEGSRPDIWVSEPETIRSGKTLSVSAKMVGATDAPLVIDRSKVRFTVIGSSHAVDILGCTG